MKYKHICLECSKPFTHKRINAKFCCRECFIGDTNCLIKNCKKIRRANGFCSHHNFKNREYGNPYEKPRRSSNFTGCIRFDGYRIISVKGKRFLEHRYIMEKHLNRKLKRKEHVHHINRNKLDNRIKNLKVIDIAEHSRLHCKERKIK